VGAWSPQACYAVVNNIKKKFSCEIEVHLHNDLGLAMANAVAAIDAGATIIDTSILGVGERAGICDLFSLAVYLHKFHDQNNYQFELTQSLSHAIQKIGHFSLEPHHPIVGKNVFTHTSKYHVKAAEKNMEAYQFLEPALFSRQAELSPKDLERKSCDRLENSLQIGKPFIKGASELRYHRNGIGTRWVCMDNRVDERSSLYVIERIFDEREKEQYQPHVDCHAHHCDSVFVFLGNHEDGSGLTVLVKFGKGLNEEIRAVHSPASIFIPANVDHSYEYISGSGRFTNIVLAPNYNDSLV
jgi:2-isopropylmalate synthase